jgi:transcriptional regulator with XRE-family HTH domain
MYNLKAARIAKNMTQEELGKKVNVQKSAISKYERGEIQPSHDVLIKLSEVLDVTIDYLFGRNTELWQAAYQKICEEQPADGNAKELSPLETEILDAYKRLKESHDPKDRAAVAAVEQLLRLNERGSDDTE